MNFLKHTFATIVYPIYEFMFTGIIESLSELVEIAHEQSNITFTLKSNLAKEFKIDQSVSHNGVCLTVVSILNDTYKVTAINETLAKTNLGKWVVGDLINIERSLLANQRIDGHFVQGHVDTTGVCSEIEDAKGSWIYTIEYNQTAPEFYTVPKGSICLNGVSLTVAESGNGVLKVAIIPYTYEFTNFHSLKTGDRVNIEFDILGKYITQMAAKGMLKQN